MMTCIQDIRNHLFYTKETRRLIDSKNYSSLLRWIEKREVVATAGRLTKSKRTVQRDAVETWRIGCLASSNC